MVNYYHGGDAKAKPVNASSTTVLPNIQDNTSKNLFPEKFLLYLSMLQYMQPFCLGDPLEHVYSFLTKASYALHYTTTS